MTTEIQRQPGVPAHDYPRHISQALGDRTPTKLRYGHSFARDEYRRAKGLTVRAPSWNWLGLLWLVACFIIGAAFALAF